ncbi:hypothetical protein Sjap_015462 [Stephania japonica]|uniref:Uncharacterized protein n=1 Tax=Stephania japonica TaxID=461633 RepID=A0AAP0NSV8_9MAGN
MGRFYRENCGAKTYPVPRPTLLCGANFRLTPRHGGGKNAENSLPTGARPRGGRGIPAPLATLDGVDSGDMRADNIKTSCEGRGGKATRSSPPLPPHGRRRRRRQSIPS